jgi:hypothetical protein
MKREGRGKKGPAAVAFIRFEIGDLRFEIKELKN